MRLARGVGWGAATAACLGGAVALVLRRKSGAVEPPLPLGAGETPTLGHLAELVEHAEATGLRVRIRGQSGVLSARVDTAVYRIVQESLTNVVRHANQAGTVDIRFRRRESAIEVVVRDDGTGARTPRTGSGLRGMHRHAEDLGGSLTALAHGAGGFEVRAVLPVERAQ